MHQAFTVYYHCRHFFVYLQRNTYDHIHVPSLTCSIFLFPFLLCPCIYILVELFVCYNVSFFGFLLFNLYFRNMIPCNPSRHWTHSAGKDYIDFLILIPLIWNTEITGVYFHMMLYISINMKTSFKYSTKIYRWRTSKMVLSIKGLLSNLFNWFWFPDITWWRRAIAIASCPLTSRYSW